MTTASITTLSRLAINASNSGTINSIIQLVDFIDFKPGVEQELRDLNGTRGKLSKDGNRVRPNLLHINPRLRTQPTAVELEAYLPWILGTTVSGTTYALSNTAIPYSAVYDWGLASGNSWLFTGLGVDEATFSGSSGEPMDLNLSLLSAISGSFSATQVIQTGQNFAASPTPLDTTTQPFMFIDSSSGITINGGANTTVKDFSITVNNGLDRSRYLNSQVLTLLQKLTRRITVSCSVPYGFYISLFGVSLTSSTLPSALSVPVTMVAVFTNGGSILTFSLVDVRFKPISPDVIFQQENFLRLEGEAYMDPATAATLPLVTTLAPGP